MAILLLLRNSYIKFIHIALFLAVISWNVEITAQTVLLPGDLVIVTANADTQFVDFIPLVNIESNTSIYFSNGRWNETDKTLRGNEVSITFKQSITAGTNIPVRATDNDLFSINGTFNFSKKTDHLFAYQKDENDEPRFLYAIGWGSPDVWGGEDAESSDIPTELTEFDDVILTLGEEENYQYYIRNGASGTPEMLLAYVSDAANWRGRSLAPYPPFGTSFNMLQPPVVLFEKSISTETETTGEARINVLLFGHDGSRLTVDLSYDSLRSIAGTEDLNGYQGETINFTGVVGDGVYEVIVPIVNDSDYEGRETAIFTLRNLSKGSLGDFIDHSLVIVDDELPSVEISGIVNSENEKNIELRNKETGVISFRGWTLTNKKKTLTMSENVVLHPGGVILLADGMQITDSDSVNRVLMDLNSIVDSKGGELVLKDQNGNHISRKKYAKTSPKKKRKKQQPEQKIVHENDSSQRNNFEGSSLGEPSFGWGQTDQFEGEQYPDFKWDEPFRKLTMNEDLGHDGYSQLKQSGVLQTTLSATDSNENGVIDGLEGFNLLQNAFGREISSNDIIDAIQKAKPELNISPVIYTLRQDDAGNRFFVGSDDRKMITPGAPFWISITEPHKEEQLSLEIPSVTPATSVPEDETSSYFLLELLTEDGSEFIRIEFDESDPVYVKNMNAYRELYSVTERYMNFSIALGQDYFTKMNFPLKTTQPFKLPLAIDISEERFQLRVSEWRHMPKGREVVLKDLQQEKEYQLNDDAFLNFTHNATQSDTASENRFMMVIKPSSSVQDTGSEIETADMPMELELQQNYPNPFNPITTISFYLPEAEEVKLSVFNIVGQPISVLTDGALSAGFHHYDWDATDRPSGMYIYQLEVRNKIMTRKMTLVK